VNILVLHANSIIHGDIKPANIMFVEKPVAGTLPQIKFIDFGISQVLTNGAKSDFGTGTPAYNPPDVAIGLIMFYTIFLSL